MQKIGHEEIVLVHKKQVSSCIRGGLDWLSGTTSSLKVFLGIRIGCPRKQWNLLSLEEHANAVLRDMV